ncbi:MAG: hypothetical protein CLLPBCKN_002031 [Chroococcidiopsis cubana SAG 39.79]|uniref:Uncharacterized protein n=1 Tax=Chroococcidiopsis cubana SAG 39.79 TaxID=388085 RepID=A0AB37ULD6_9CYAN|nr:MULTISPECIES: hypothetical protein [Chroococcidiopsis]PSB45257.1 hypothetical protein C7B80_17635 [Cyanosarcina cf. burmensis CCALA 770]MDZ4872635.1 hypothetical protein [Chroococcidiopsis cubana SAG 39.79]PSB62927.1 hypothetical protein C7B79_15940 [Chroococcidiopsis cubana CCALA 043]RUT12149.1 hypothetical protein DSM107010_25640 [Chroococcidiopsis cubana SAG 39.79]URD49777.1 hypothetical protein M5J74_26125 [Chroococcidiopsis sp. CCNUC1]
MAKLSDETLGTIFTLQRQLVEGMDEAAATESRLFEQFGETEETLPVLEQLLNVRERLLAPYSRLSALLPRISEYQPTAPTDVVNLLYQNIEQAQAARDASIASIREAKRDFDLHE